MNKLKLAGLLLVFLVANSALAQESISPKSSAVESTKEQVLEARVKELEKKVEELSTRIADDGSKRPDQILVDPDLAMAAQRDATVQEQKQAFGLQSESPTPVVTPVAKLNPDISFILDSGLGWFSDAEHLRQSGHAIDENGFALQALELAASASVDPYFRFDLNFQVQHLHLEEAFLTTLALPANLQARAGYFNAAFGRQNPQHLHIWNFVNPPLSHTRFMSEEHFSGAGVELSHILPLPWYAVVLSEVMLPSSAAAFRSSSFGMVEANNNGRVDGVEDFVYVERIENFFELATDWSLLLGTSVAFSQSPYVPGNRAAVYGGDLYLKWRPLSRESGFSLALTLEAVLRDTQVPLDSVRDWGGYAQLDVALSRRFLAGLRADLTDLVSGTVPDPAKFPERQVRGSVSFTFLPTHFSKIRLQTDVSKVKPADKATFAFFVQAEVSAGEHGAHRF